MSTAPFDPDVRDRDNLAEQDLNEMVYAELGAILQRVRDLEKTVPKIVVNEPHISKLGELHQIIEGMRNRHFNDIARARQPDS